NDVSAATTALAIAAAFAGQISDNDFRGASVGVSYAAAADLSGNRIRDNATGVVSTVGGASGLGFVGVSAPNRIYRNTLGVQLTGAMQNQAVFGNGTGVRGSGVLGGTDLARPNLIEANGVGVDAFAGPVRYNRVSRNGTGVVAASGQLVS